MSSKRVLDVVVAVSGLLVLCPLIAVVALWIKMDSHGPVFFRQTRVGKHGRLFTIYKFRTMLAGAESDGRKITAADDERISTAGRMLRRYKLDEIPQLLNVLKGEMSLVGPRPEVPEYVACYPPQLREKILSVLPGITDAASVAFAHEADVLAAADDPAKYYVSHILPEKLALYAAYVDHRSLLGDVKLIIETLRTIFIDAGRPPRISGR